MENLLLSLWKKIHKVCTCLVNVMIIFLKKSLFFPIFSKANYKHLKEFENLLNPILISNFKLFLIFFFAGLFLRNDNLLKAPTKSILNLFSQIFSESVSIRRTSELQYLPTNLLKEIVKSLNRPTLHNVF